MDSHNYPNLALMKIAAYYDSRGDFAEWYEPMRGQGFYDAVYMSKVFTDSLDYNTPTYADAVYKGGTGNVRRCDAAGSMNDEECPDCGGTGKRVVKK